MGTTIRKAAARGWQAHQVLHLMADVYHGYRLDIRDDGLRRRLIY
jgi:hypothetical protein